MIHIDAKYWKQYGKVLQLRLRSYSRKWLRSTHWKYVYAHSGRRWKYLGRGGP